MGEIWVKKSNPLEVALTAICNMLIG